MKKLKTLVIFAVFIIFMFIAYIIFGQFFEPRGYNFMV